MDLQGSRINDSSIRIDRVLNCPVLDSENLRADLRLSIGIEIAQFPPDHQTNDFIVIKRMTFMINGFNCLPVTQDRRSIRDFRDFVQFMGNYDHGYATVP